MRYTVEQVLRKLAKHNGENGSCWDAPSNLSRLNDVRELIYEKGNFEGTVEWGCVRIDDCQCIYLPAHLESVRGAWISSRPVLLRGQNYMSLDSIGRGYCCTCSQDSRRALQVTGVRRPIVHTPPDTFSLSVLFEDETDSLEEEVLLTVKYSDGRTGVLRFPEPELTPDTEAQDNIRIKDVTEAVKGRTRGRVFVRGEVPSGDIYTIAEYQPWQENPRFTQMRLVNYMQGDCDRSLVVFAKKAYRRFSGMKDLVEIESIQALRFGYLAFNALDGNRDTDYASKVGMMVQSLSDADMNLTPDEATVEINPHYAAALDPRYDCGSRF